MTKVAIVTGGTTGIGLAIVKKFLKNDYSVAVVSIEEESEVKDTLDELNGEVKFYQCDISNVEQTQNTVKQVNEDFGQLDVLVNNAGVVGERKHLIDADIKDIHNTININLIGSINMAQAAAQLMVKAKSGTIVNIGSLCGFIANHESIGYHASKGGTKMFTSALAREVGPYGVRVVSAAPGWVQTALVTEDIAAEGGKLHMRQDQIVQPEEIANVVYFLTTKEASCINGTTVMVDDGYTGFKGAIE